MTTQALMVSGESLWTGEVRSWNCAVVAVRYASAEAPPALGAPITVLVLGEVDESECSLRGEVEAICEENGGFTVEVAVSAATPGYRAVQQRWLTSSGERVRPSNALESEGWLRTPSALHGVEVLEMGAEGVHLVGGVDPLPTLPLGAIVRLELDGVEVALIVGRQRRRRGGVEAWLEAFDPTARAALAAQAASWTVLPATVEVQGGNRPVETEETVRVA